MHIWWLGQSGFLVQIDGENLLVDPYLSDSLTEKYAGTDTPHERITDLVVDPALLSFVDVVISSQRAAGSPRPRHAARTCSRASAAFVCAAGSEDVAAERAGRLPDAVLAVGERRDVRRLLDRGRSRLPREARPKAVGYVVRNGAYAFYHAGDSRRVQGMAEAVAPHGVDVAFVPDQRPATGTWTAPTRPGSPTRQGRSIAIPCHHEMFRCDTASTVALRRRVRAARRRSTASRGAGERITIDYGS